MASSETARIAFMGRGNRSRHGTKLWWDVRLLGGWLVIHAGRSRRPSLPSVYWSPNGTPWHHGARSIFNAKHQVAEPCLCESTPAPVVRGGTGNAD
jgi:hypothetical protein